MEAEVKIKINETSILFTGEIRLIFAGCTRQKHCWNMSNGAKQGKSQLVEPLGQVFVGMEVLKGFSNTFKQLPAKTSGFILHLSILLDWECWFCMAACLSRNVILGRFYYDFFFKY